MRPQRTTVNNKPNYRLDPYKSYFSNRKKKDLYCVVLPEPFETWWSKWKERGMALQFADDYSMYPSSIFMFKIKNNQKVFVCNQFTIDGVSENDVVRKDSVNFMYWIDAVYAFPKVTKRLLQIGWYTSEERKKYELPSVYQPQFKIRDMLYFVPIKFCVCDRLDGKCTGECVEGIDIYKAQILGVNGHRAVGQLSFEYSLRTWNRSIGKSSCSEDQLFSEQPKEINYPDFSDIVFSTIRNAIFCGKDIDEIEFIIPKAEWPKDCRKDSALYGKLQQYILCKSSITEFESNIHILLMNKQMVQQIIFRLFEDKLSILKNVSIQQQNIITKATKKDMDLFGTPIPELLFDYGVKIICHENNIDLNYNIKDIQYESPLESLTSFGVSKILKQNDDKTIVQISSPSISWRYIRDKSVIMLHRFSYKTIKPN